MDREHLILLSFLIGFLGMRAAGQTMHHRQDHRARDGSKRKTQSFLLFNDFRTSLVLQIVFEPNFNLIEETIGIDWELAGAIF